MGEVFAGRYELVDPIGRGGVGAVWRAWDQRRRRYVAAKVLQQSDAHTLLRFVREQALRIDHPHVLAPASWAADDDKVLFTMDLVGGGSFAHLIGDYGPLPPRFVCVLLDQLLSGLAAVHQEGVVHRDIKPANILLEATGTARPHVRLSDFGIALTKGEPRLTEADFVMGTPGYFAPEQMQGAEPDFPADLFAVGLVTLYLLSGHKPDADAIVRRFQEQGVPPAPDGVPEPLWQVVATLLQPDPEARFRTATGARKALATVSELLPDPDLDDEVIEVFDHLGPLPAGYGPEGPERKGSRSHRKPPARVLSPASDTGGFPLPPPRPDMIRPGPAPVRPVPGPPDAGPPDPQAPPGPRTPPGPQAPPDEAPYADPALRPGHYGEPARGYENRLPPPGGTVPPARGPAPTPSAAPLPAPLPPLPGHGHPPHHGPDGHDGHDGHGSPNGPGPYRYGQPPRPGAPSFPPPGGTPHPPVPGGTPHPTPAGPPTPPAPPVPPLGTPQGTPSGATPPTTPNAAPPPAPAPGPVPPVSPPTPTPTPIPTPTPTPPTPVWPPTPASRYPGQAATPTTRPYTAPGPGPAGPPMPETPLAGVGPGSPEARRPGTGAPGRPGPPAKVVVPVLIVAVLCFVVGAWAWFASG